jgi:hypothetical protein
MFDVAAGWLVGGQIDLNVMMDFSRVLRGASAVNARNSDCLIALGTAGRL